MKQNSKNYKIKCGVSLFLVVSLQQFFVLQAQTEVKESTTESVAQTVTLKGIVKARGGGGAASGVAVIAFPQRENNTTTDANGSFSFSVPLNTEYVLLRGAAFEELKIALSNGKLPDEEVILLDPSPELVGVGIIRARRKTEVSQSSLQRRELERIPGSQGDAVKSLQVLPSVLPAGPVGTAAIVVRGGAPGDNRFFLDRLELPFVYHLGGLGTVVPTRMLEGIDLFAGGFSSIYGDATGGIIQLRTENSIPEQKSGQFELGLTQSSLYYEGSMGEKNEESDNRVGYRVGFRRTYLEVLKPAIKYFSEKNSKGQVGLVTLPQATDYQFVLNGVHKNGTWQAYLLGAADRLSLVTPTSISDQGDGRSKFSLFNYFETMGLRYNLNLANGWGLTLSPQQRYAGIHQEFFGNTIDIVVNRFAFDVILDKRVNQIVSLSLGVRPEYERQKTKIDSIQFPAGGITVFFDPDTAPRNKTTLTRDISSGFAYVDLNIKPSKELLINPGVNFLKGSTPQQLEWDPRISTRYEFMENQTLKLATGYYSQRPEPQFDAPGYGNEKLKLERAIHYVAGIESVWAENIDSDVQIYQKKMFSLVGTATENPADKYENNGEARSSGIELLVKRKSQGRWFGWISYGFSKAERRDPLNGIWRKSSFDRPHALNLLASYKITGQWQLGTKFQFLSGSPYSNIKGGTFNQNTGRYLPYSDGTPVSIAINDERNPNYYQIDLRSDYDFLFDTWKLNYYIDVTNVTNQKNIVGSRWAPDYSKRELVYGIPIIPNMGIVASF